MDHYMDIGSTVDKLCHAPARRHPVGFFADGFIYPNIGCNPDTYPTLFDGYVIANGTCNSDANSDPGTTRLSNPSG
jgi:hypothetical protein